MGGSPRILRPAGAITERINSSNGSRVRRCGGGILSAGWSIDKGGELGLCASALEDSVEVVVGLDEEAGADLWPLAFRSTISRP